MAAKSIECNPLWPLAVQWVFGLLAAAGVSGCSGAIARPRARWTRGRPMAASSMRGARARRPIAQGLALRRRPRSVRMEPPWVAPFAPGWPTIDAAGTSPRARRPMQRHVSAPDLRRRLRLPSVPMDRRAVPHAHRTRTALAHGHFTHAPHRAPRWAVFPIVRMVWPKTFTVATLASARRPARRPVVPVLPIALMGSSRT